MRSAAPKSGEPHAAATDVRLLEVQAMEYLTKYHINKGVSSNDVVATSLTKRARLVGRGIHGTWGVLAIECNWSGPAFHGWRRSHVN